MHFRFFLSDPHGSLELSTDDLEQPFLTNPSEKHPFLILKDYFGALQKFILSRDGALLCAALHKQNLQHIDLADISEVLISSEKHGAFYHIASIALSGLERKIRFAVTTALSASAKASLIEEFFIMQRLAGLNPDYLPAVYCSESVTWLTDSGAEEFFMVLGEWLAGYHEWHLTNDQASGRQQVHLWDYDSGYHFLSESESQELLLQVAHILTYYYDQASFRQIYPWHHGAGDFVVKVENGVLSVKLITARQYEALVHFGEEEKADRLVAAIHFLLNLVMRIRLDRIDGVGGPAWIEDFSVLAAVEGFFSGLRATSTTNRQMIGSLEDFLEILQTFDFSEIVDMYKSLLQVYAEEDPDDFRLIQANLQDHASQLHEILQTFSLEKP
jgi:hypothetical protein